jgi:uncharacterized membrane protein
MKEMFVVAVEVVEAAAVMLMLIGLALSTARYLHGFSGKDRKAAYAIYRRDLGRSLLLTLEFLIAADIIETVAIEKTLQSVGILGALVVVRTFLSFALEVELSGRWPWQSASSTSSEE